MKIVFTLTFILLLASFAFAQTKNKPSVTVNKVALLNWELISDKDAGIKRLVEAERLLSEQEPGELANILSYRIDELDKEIFCLKSQNQPFQEKVDEREKLNKELTLAKAKENERIEKLISTLITPVEKKIIEKLKEFARLKGYPIIINKSRPPIFIEGEPVDITIEFIKFCNESFDKEK